jgi:putative membrane protein
MSVGPDARRGGAWQAGRMYGDHMDGWGWMMMVLWSIVAIGFVGIAAWFLMTWGHSGSSDSAPSQPPAKTARELLDERLASGDIDPDDYTRRRATLEQHTPAGA